MQIHERSASRLAPIVLLLAILVAGCAPRYMLPGPTAGRPHLTPEALVARDGAALPLRHWDADTPHAVIIALHGFNDYSNCFSDAATFWAKNGVTTYAYDQRGFGGAPNFGRWPGSEAFIDDLDDAVAVVASAHPGVPLYVLGESMGAAVTLAWADRTGASGANGLVLVAPAVWGWSTLNPLYRTTLWVTAHTTPAKTLTGARLKRWPSDNIPMLRALSRDPKVIKATRIDAIYGLVGLMDKGYRATRAPAGAKAPPILLLYGEHDQIVPKKPVKEAADALGPRARYVLYPDGYHMLLRDLHGRVVWKDVESFVTAPGQILPSGLERQALRP